MAKSRRPYITASHSTTQLLMSIINRYAGSYKTRRICVRIAKEIDGTRVFKDTLLGRYVPTPKVKRPYPKYLDPVIHLIMQEHNRGQPHDIIADWLRKMHRVPATTKHIKAVVKINGGTNNG